jgi:AcrR family transcriptional regulator
MMSPATIGLRERGKQRRIELILAAARELLREFPDQALTVDRIATRAEVSAPTVFNLIGRREHIWAALADQALRDLDLGALRVIEDPQERARAIVDAVISMICADASVFRALLANWEQSARVIDHDPTSEIEACLVAAAGQGSIIGGSDLRRRAELISAGLIGLVHQWGAGLLRDRALHARGRDLVDFAFDAARGHRSSDTTAPASKRPVRSQRKAR